MASAVCAQPGCPELIPPGGGVRGYCDRHSSEAVIEAIDRLTQVLEAQVTHIARIDSNIASIENIARVTAQQ